MENKNYYLSVMKFITEALTGTVVAAAASPLIGETAARLANEPHIAKFDDIPVVIKPTELSEPAELSLDVGAVNFAKYSTRAIVQSRRDRLVALLHKHPAKPSQYYAEALHVPIYIVWQDMKFLRDNNIL